MCHQPLPTWTGSSPGPGATRATTLGSGHCVTRSVGGQSGTGDSAPGGPVPCGHTGWQQGTQSVPREF